MDEEASWITPFLCCLVAVRHVLPTILLPASLHTKIIETENQAQTLLNCESKIHHSSVFFRYLSQQSLLRHTPPGVTSINFSGPAQSNSTRASSLWKLLLGLLIVPLPTGDQADSFSMTLKAHDLSTAAVEPGLLSGFL